MVKMFKCAYCGNPCEKSDKEHVFPSCLYPKTETTSTIQRLTIPACNSCNNSWADDEAHFRNVLVIAGDPSTPIKSKLWATKVDKSFNHLDGRRRVEDLFQEIVRVEKEGKTYNLIFPGNDKRVIRVIRKIIRGLYYYHELPYPLDEAKISVDVLKFHLPQELLEQMKYQHRDKEIIEYRYLLLDQDNLESVWILTFFQTVKIIAVVSNPN